MITILDRHIGRTVLYSTLLVLGVLAALFTFFDFVDKLEDVGQANFSMVELLRYLALTLPRKVYELFPMAALVGTTLGLSSLAIDSELIAMRAAGVSLMRIVGSVLKTGALFVLAAVLIGEAVAPPLENLAQRGRNEALRVGIQQNGNSIWLRDGPAFVNIREVLPDLSVLGIDIYVFNEQNRLAEQIYAEDARYEQGRWRLRRVSQSVIEPDHIRIEERDFTHWNSAIDPEVLAVFAVKPEGLSAWNLFRYIRHLARNSQETARYRLALWYKIVSPFTTAVMVVLAIPFVFMSLRSGGMGGRLFIGIMLGLSFYVVSRGFGFFSLLYGISPFIGAALPTLLFLGIALYLLRRVA